MRYRIVLLIAVASLLGTPVLVHRYNAQVACLNIPDTALCAAAMPEPFWVRPFGLVSLAVLGYALYEFTVSWLARRREKQMLDAVGVHVREEDLPLED